MCHKIIELLPRQQVVLPPSDATQHCYLLRGYSHLPGTFRKTQKSIDCFLKLADTYEGMINF